MIGSVAGTAIDKLRLVAREPATEENPTMDSNQHAEQNCEMELSLTRELKVERVQEIDCRDSRVVRCGSSRLVGCTVVPDRSICKRSDNTMHSTAHRPRKSIFGRSIGREAGCKPNGGSKLFHSWTRSTDYCRHAGGAAGQLTGDCIMQ